MTWPVPQISSAVLSSFTNTTPAVFTLILPDARATSPTTGLPRDICRGRVCSHRNSSHSYGRTHNNAAVACRGWGIREVLDLIPSGQGPPPLGHQYLDWIAGSLNKTTTRGGLKDISYRSFDSQTERQIFSFRLSFLWEQSSGTKTCFKGYDFLSTHLLRHPHPFFVSTLRSSF